MPPTQMLLPLLAATTVLANPLNSEYHHQNDHSPNLLHDKRGWYADFFEHGLDPAPPPHAAGLIHSVQIVMDNNTASPDHGNDLNSYGGIVAPPVKHYLNVYDIPPYANQDVDWCQWNKTTSSADVTPYVNQVSVEGGDTDAPAHPGPNKDFGGILWKSFSGNTIGENCTFNGSTGDFGSLRCDGMGLHPKGVLCAAPPTTPVVKDKTCTDPDGGTNALHLAAVCRW